MTHLLKVLNPVRSGREQLAHVNQTMDRIQSLPPITAKCSQFGEVSVDIHLYGEHL